MYSVFYVGPIVILAHYWIKTVYCRSKMMRGLERLKHMKSENNRLQEEYERLESSMMEIESSKPFKSEKSEADEAEAYMKKLEIVKNLEEEIEAMAANRETLLEELEIAKKQKDDSIKAFQDYFMYQGLRKNPHHNTNY